MHVNSNLPSSSLYGGHLTSVGSLCSNKEASSDQKELNERWSVLDRHTTPWLCSLAQWPWERKSPWGPLPADCGLLTCCPSNQTSQGFDDLSQRQKYRLWSFFIQLAETDFPHIGQNISLFSPNTIKYSFNMFSLSIIINLLFSQLT